MLPLIHESSTTLAGREDRSLVLPGKVGTRGISETKGDDRIRMGSPKCPSQRTRHRILANFCLFIGALGRDDNAVTLRSWLIRGHSSVGIRCRSPVWQIDFGLCVSPCPPGPWVINGSSRMALSWSIFISVSGTERRKRNSGSQQRIPVHCSASGLQYRCMCLPKLLNLDTTSLKRGGAIIGLKCHGVHFLTVHGVPLL